MAESTQERATRIEGGIEWFTYEREGETEEGCQCARCGSSCFVVDCWDCGGEGGYLGEEIAGDYDFGWIDEDAWYTCRTCSGTGGYWACCSGRDWCEANPLLGREEITTTATARDDD